MSLGEGGGWILTLLPAKTLKPHRIALVQNRAQRKKLLHPAPSTTQNGFCWAGSSTDSLLVFLLSLFAYLTDQHTFRIELILR